MKFEISTLLPSELAHALGWTLLHSLWQATAVALLLAAVLAWLPPGRAQWRYVAALGALLLVPLAAAFTFLQYYQPMAAEAAFGESLLEGPWMPAADVWGAPSEGAGWRLWIEARLPLLALVWLAGSALLALRLLGGLAWLWWLRQRVEPLEAQWRARVRWLAQMAGVRQALVVAQSHLVRAPVAFGLFKPVVLLPVGLVNQLPPEAVEAILMHELLHIRRADFAARLLQSLVEVCFYYHPAVWWINGVIGREREHACDDAVVRHLGDRFRYARALMMAQELTGAAQPALALGLRSRPGALMLRIQRMIDPSTQNHRIMEKMTAMVLLVTALLLGARWAHSHNDQPVPEPVSSVAVTDTLPKGEKEMKEVTRIVKVEDGRTLEIEMEGETITKVIDDGRPVPPEQYEQYRDEVEEMRREAVEPIVLDVDTVITFFPEENLKRIEIVVDEDMGPDTVIVFDQDFNADTIVLDEGEQLEWEEEDPWRHRHRMDLRMERLERELERMARELERMFEGKDEEIRRRIEEALEETQRAMERLQQELPLPDDEDLERLHEQVERELEIARRRAEIELGRTDRPVAPEPPVKWMEALERQLIEDGLIEPGQSWSLELSDKRMKVNGRKMPEDVHQRYVELYARYHGKPSGKWKIEYRNEL